MQDDGARADQAPDGGVTGPLAEDVPDWPGADLVDEVFPVVAGLAASGRPFALATICAADGGPRPVGSQMVVTPERWWGFLSGGCVEADVARHARASLADGEPRRLAYGHGSPFLDIRLPCGGRIEILVERVAPDDPAIRALLDLTRRRRPARYLTDGRARLCRDAGSDPGPDRAWAVDRTSWPAQRLVVVGHDPFALAIAAGGLGQGWEVALVRPGGPAAPPPLDVGYHRSPVDEALGTLGPDAWTAIAVATHDADLDHAALTAALLSDAGYVGLLGSRRRLGDRLGRLRSAGMPEAFLARLHAPIGVPLGGRAPHEIAVAVAAEVIDHRAQACRPTLGRPDHEPRPGPTRAGPAEAASPGPLRAAR